MSISRAMLRVLPALAGYCSALTGCIDLSPVSPPAEQPTVLHLSLRLSDLAEGGGEGALVTLTAALATGVDEVGRTRGIRNDTLVLFGEPVPAVDIGVGRGVYSETLLLERAALFSAPFTIRAPLVENLQPFEFPVRWPLLRKAQPPPTSVEPGEDLVLPLEFDGFPGEPVPEVQRWSVAVFREDGWFSQGADGLPPEEIVVPGSLLGAPGTGMLAVVNMTHSVQIPSGDGYFTRLELSQELRWNVSVTSPAMARRTPKPYQPRTDPVHWTPFQPVDQP